jgi:thiamine-phosphate pyrophosphorylase
MPAAHRGDRFRGLHVLADDDPRWPIGPVAQAEAACRGGAHVVQLRCKHATDAQQLALAREIRALTRRAGACFVLNDRFDLALAAEADAVHVGQTDIPPHRIPEAVRSRLAVGLSTHDAAQARAALDEPIDYLAFGPVFGTTSKESEYSRRGLDLLQEVAAIMKPAPLVAIGGITLDNLAEVGRAGASGFAVISAVAAADDPEAAARALADAADESACESADE